MDGHATKLLDRRTDDRGIGVVDGARRQRITRRNDFVARREDSDTWAPVNADRGESQRREDADLARGQVLSRSKHRFASGDVGPRIAHVLPGRERPPDLQELAGFGLDEFRMLDHQDGIGAARKHAAGGNRRCKTADYRPCQARYLEQGSHCSIARFAAFPPSRRRCHWPAQRNRRHWSGRNRERPPPPGCRRQGLDATLREEARPPCRAGEAADARGIWQSLHPG